MSYLVIEAGLLIGVVAVLIWMLDVFITVPEGDSCKKD